MKNLTREGFIRARDYMLTQARPLERSIFELTFENGSVDQVLMHLENFQNADGGFGHSLEPDVRTPTSSALCTEIGLRYLAEWGQPPENSMVKAAVKYLIDSFSPDSQTWRVVPVDTNDYPHAPWWHNKKGSLAQTFDKFKVIPRAGILLSLYHYAEIVPADWLAEVTDQTIESIESLQTERFGGGGDTLVYALRLAQAPGLPDPLKARLWPFLRDVADAVVARDPDEWSGYSTPPIKLAPTPGSPVAELLADDLQVYLDYMVDQQTFDGAWEPTWHWGENYPDDWVQAKKEWRGILTLDALIALRAFDRLAD